MRVLLCRLLHLPLSITHHSEYSYTCKTSSSGLESHAVPQLNGNMGNAISRTDAGFGPLLSGHSDFTLIFEESIFTTAPAAVVIITTIAKMLSVVGKPKTVRPGALLGLKFVLGLTLAAAHLATLVLWIHLLPVQTEMTLPAAGLAFGGSVAVVLFLVVEHFYSYQLSTFMSLFLSITLLLDIAKTYSCFNRTGLGPACAMYILSSVARFLLLVCQEISKRRLIYDEELRSTVNGESAIGFWNRSLFLWVNSTLLLGFKQILRVEDLPSLAPEFRAKTLFEAFKPQWDRGKTAVEPRIYLVYLLIGSLVQLTSDPTMLW